MYRLPAALFLALVCSVAPAQPQDALLLHYAFDEGQGTVATDASANALNATVGAAWTDSPSGKALSLDGQSAGIVRVQIPEELRFGKGSWTFSAWLKPAQFTIEDPQNQRRVFAFGTYPDAYLVIDIFSNGRPGYYFCYRDEADKIVSTGGSAASGLKLDEWAFVALVCDRDKRRVEIYINGYSQGATTIPAGFAGDFSLGGELTLGSGWHNYCGLMDEARVYRRALSRPEIKAEFAGLKDTFGAVESPEAIAAEKRELLMQEFSKTHDLWAAGDFAAVRAACAALVGSTDVPAALRSYAHLRIAQSHAAEGNGEAAKAQYAQIAAAADYPEVHREEAEDCVAEIDRVAQGLPARDPAASRTNVPAIVQFAAELFVSRMAMTPTTAARSGRWRPSSGPRPCATHRHRWADCRERPARRVPGHRDPCSSRPRTGGRPDALWFYRATEPGKAVLYGGTRITGFEPVTDAAILSGSRSRPGARCCAAILRPRASRTTGNWRYGALASRPRRRRWSSSWMAGP